MQEPLPIHIQQPIAAEKFKIFNDVQNQILPVILNDDPKTIGDSDPPQTYAVGLVKDKPLSQWTESTKNITQQYVELEKRINQYEDTVGNSSNLQESLRVSLGIDSADAIHAVKRIHGGYTIVLSPQEFQHYLKLTYIENGQKTDQTDETIIQKIREHREMGFLLDQEEISKIPGLPKGIHIAIIADVGRVDQAIQHEQSEIIGQVFDDAFQQDRFVRLLDRLTPKNTLPPDIDRKFLQRVGYDIAAHLEQGDSLNLARVGLTAEDVMSHPRETLLIKTLISQISQLQQSGKSFDELANTIRGGTMRFENLLCHLLGVQETEKVINNLTNPQITLTEEDTRGVSFKTQPEGKKGRFVYIRSTLQDGDTLQYRGIKFKVKKTLKAGGFGATFIAENQKTHQMVVIKELVSTSLPSLLLEGPQKAGSFFDSLVKHLGHKNQGGKLPLEAINEFYNILQTHYAQDSNVQKICDAFYVSPICQKYISNKLNPNQINAFTAIAEIRQAIVDFFTQINDPQNSCNNALRNIRDNFNKTVEQYRNEYEALLAIQDHVKKSNLAKPAPDPIALITDPTTVSDEFAYQKYNNIYLVQEMVSGERFTEKYAMDQNVLKIPNVTRAISIGISMCQAMHAIHTSIYPGTNTPIVHRDVKPDNMFIDQYGNVQYIDFGIAKLARGGGTMKALTLGYSLATDVLSSSTPQCDIFSNGIVLFQLLTGTSIDEISTANGKIDAGTNVNALKELINRKFTHLNLNGLNTKAFNIDKQTQQQALNILKAIILKATEVSQANRYQTDLEMQRYLTKVHNMLVKTNQLAVPLILNAQLPVAPAPTPTVPITTPPTIPSQTTLPLAPPPSFPTPTAPLQPASPIPRPSPPPPAPRIPTADERFKR